MNHYALLIKKLREISDIRAAQAVLEWDQQTYMPSKGGEARSRQAGMLAGFSHEKLSAPEVGDLIEKCASDHSLNAEERALVREAKRDRDKAIKVPISLVREIADTSSRAIAVWSEAKEKNNFSIFAPVLDKLIQLKIQEAKALGVPDGGILYDALLDRYEPGARVRDLNPLISQTKEICLAALQAVKKSKRKSKKQIFKKNFPSAQQEKLAHYVISKLGFDLAAGRLDKSAHPFTTNFDVSDVRITTRYLEKWLPAALYGAIHECGHAIYEQALPKNHSGTPLGEALSLAIHESQSRFYENQIGRSYAFCKFLNPQLKKLFPGLLSKLRPDDFYSAVNEIKPSLIRVQADEVTYNQHIILRYELEQAIIGGEIATKDLPAVWNEKMISYLGLKPKRDAEGVLQDIHWALGAFGYFPTYLLGNLYAAQWGAVMKKEIKNFDSLVAKGSFIPIKTWLGKKIHIHGRRYPASELVKMVTGEPLNASYFENYLKTKYGEIYDVEW